MNKRHLTHLVTLGLVVVSLAACGCSGEAELSREPLVPAGNQIDLFAVSEAVWAREAVVGAEALSGAERVFLYVWNLEAEVNNGGFDQFYINSAGDYAGVTPAALREIGASRAAEIVQAANSVFGPMGPPTDRDARWEALDGLGAPATDVLGELDARFYEYPDDLEALLLRFVDQNRDQFYKGP
jgi:hypothetical protein